MHSKDKFAILAPINKRLKTENIHEVSHLSKRVLADDKLCQLCARPFAWERKHARTSGGAYT